MVGPVELKQGGVSRIPRLKLRKAQISCQGTSPRTPSPAKTIIGQSQTSRGGRRESELIAISTLPWLVGAGRSPGLPGVGGDALPRDPLITARQKRQRTDQSSPDCQAGCTHFELE